jgi:hypothetical protein
VIFRIPAGSGIKEIDHRDIMYAKSYKPGQCLVGCFGKVYPFVALLDIEEMQEIIGYIESLED